MKYILIDEINGDEYELKFNEEIEKSTKLTNEKYKEIREELKPLPDKYYVDRRDGKCFAQFHLRGILPEDYEAFEKGTKSFRDIILKRSLHEDLRYKLKGLDKLVQYVITESSMDSYIRMMKGELNPEQKGAPNIQKSKILSKPSGEPTEEWLKRHAVKSKDEKGALIDKKGAEIIDKYIIHEKSYWLKPGQVGCVTAFDLILTDHGYEYARNLRVGDLVYTDKGRFRPITKVIDRGIVHKLSTTLRSKMFNLDIVFYNHNLITNDGIKSDSEISTDDFLKLAKPIGDYEHPSEITLFINPSYEKIIKINKDFVRWIGFFVGDGSIINHDKGVISLDCANDKEADFYENLTRKVFKIKNVTRLKFDGVNGGYVSLRFTDRGLAHYLSVNCYYHNEKKNAMGKKFPLFFNNLDEKLTREALEGYIDADGHRNSNKIEIASISRYLIGQTFYMLLKLGILSSICILREKNGNINRCYAISFQFDRIKSKMRDINADAKYFYIPVKKINRKRYESGSIHIFDFEIQEDHSFTVGNFAVRNSTPYTYAYLGTIWTGKVKEGTSRTDLHELFMYPDEDLPDINKKLFDGRFIIRCFTGTDNRPNTWWIWKATKDKFPLNPYCSIDAGFHYLIPATKVKYFGHESYPKWKERKADCK